MWYLLVRAGYRYGTVCAVQTIFRVQYSTASTSTESGKQQWYLAWKRKRQTSKVKLKSANHNHKWGQYVPLQYVEPPWSVNQGQDQGEAKGDIIGTGTDLGLGPKHRCLSLVPWVTKLQLRSKERPAVKQRGHGWAWAWAWAWDGKGWRQTRKKENHRIERKVSGPENKGGGQGDQKS